MSDLPASARHDARGASLIDSADKKSSRPVLDALLQSEKAFRSYQDECNRIDALYSAKLVLDGRINDLGMTDNSYDTFWASMEVLKPAIYARTPRVIAKPRFSDATPADKIAAEMIERVVNSEFERGNIDLHLKEVRDDLALLNRGVLRVSYEAKDGDKRVCVDHVDRHDYRHDPVRYWRELGWEAFCAWMTEPEMRERFSKASGEAYRAAAFVSRSPNDDEGNRDEVMKAPVWEVWSKTDGKVYWVTEGVDVLLDESEPFIATTDFFSSPRPAYGTVKRRTLVPIPDYRRYEKHLDQINVCTDKIYTLLERVRVVGLLPAGGDVGNALETAIAESTTAMFIPVPGAALLANGSGNFIQFLPIAEIAQAIQGLIEARNQLFADFDRLSGISDIMRGETEAQETLGAQRLKSQYGSVRVRDKVDEIVRVARDTARIAVEIICDNFDRDTLLEVSQMDIPSRKDVDKDIDGVKKAAKAEMEALTAKATEAAQQAQASGQQVDPAQAQQMFEQAQQQLAQKYAEQLQQLQSTVVIEDVMAVIKDKRARTLIIDIETDSTVLTDELMEKQMCNELLQAFSSSISAMMPLFQIGDAGVKLAMAILERTLQPYTQGNRQIQAQLDELVEQAPEIAARMAAQSGGGESEELAEANNKLAEAEQMKAQAAMEGVKAKSAKDQADMQAKMNDLMLRARDAEAKYEQENGKLSLQLAQQQQNYEKLQAEMDKTRAQTLEILNNIKLANQRQVMDEFKSVSDIELRQGDQAMAAEGQQRDADFRERGEQRADRQQDFSEQSSDRQMSLAEQQAQQEDRNGNG